MAYGSAGHQLARSDHPGLSESAVGEVCWLKTFSSDHPSLYESAVGKVCRSDHPGSVSYTHLTLPTIYSV